MIDKRKLQLVLQEYKKDFPKLFWTDKQNNEKYKWVAVKHFQVHWDINAENFLEMFNQATAKTENLLAAMNYFPKGMIIEFCKVAPEDVRQMFRNLFDESKSVVTRVEDFIKESERLRTTYQPAEGWKSHYQNANSITTYLWLMYPDKYYIYKYSECKAVANELSTDYKPTKGAKPETLLGAIKLYDEIAEFLDTDSELLQLLRTSLDDTCYADPKLRTLAIDVGFYISRYYGKDKAPSNESQNEWWPSLEHYNVSITKDKWLKYLQEVEYEHPACMAMLKAMMELGGEATCKKLSDVYGGTPQRYVGCTMNIGRRIKGYFNLPPCMDGEEERYFALPFLGRNVIENGAKLYSYKIRDELFMALKEMDLSDIDPYVHEEADVVKEKYSKDDFLAEVYMDEDKYDTLVRLLKNKKNIILQGAPGVGKTFAAKRLAYSILGEKDDSSVEFVQFHQNYSYEDFVMGYKPEGSSFELKEGIFYHFCLKAKTNPDRDFFFIIDEINRGNMSKVFGELLMLIEKDYRGVQATLAYNGQPFSVPKNLYLIGMMNTADRSLAMIDYALRRRFSFFSMTPGFETNGFKSYQNDINSNKLNKVVTEVINLNKAITNDKSLGAGFCIGHSYFCGHFANEDEAWVQEVVEYDIVPMLNEYWFDDQESVKTWSDILIGAANG